MTGLKEKVVIRGEKTHTHVRTFRGMPFKVFALEHAMHIQEILTLMYRYLCTTIFIFLYIICLPTCLFVSVITSMKANVL